MPYVLIHYMDETDWMLFIQDTELIFFFFQFFKPENSRLHLTFLSNTALWLSNVFQ